MGKYLLIDFGASRIKSAVVDLGTGIISRKTSQPSVPPSENSGGSFVVPAAALARRFSSICSSYTGRAGVKIDGISLCSEMHGFGVIDRKGTPKTGYISWKDARGLRQVKGVSTFDLLSRELGHRFRAITGMTLRAGLPYVNAFHLARTGQLKDGDRLVSLPELLVCVSGRGVASAHETMTAGMGFYDIYRRELSFELANIFRTETGAFPVFTATGADNVCGYMRCSGREVPVYSGLGDHQCAVLGSGNTLANVSVNIGTGSQVSILSARREPGRNQQRPYFDGYYLNTITHIPAGRALNEYVLFLAKVSARFGTNKSDVWSALSSVSAARVAKASLCFDLGLFPGAWGGGSGRGAITGITEGGLTPDNYLASLLKSVAAQYSRAVGMIGPVSGKTLLLSGGISHRLPVLRRLLASSAGMDARISAEDEETFSGLRAASAVFSGSETSFVKAMQTFNRRK